MKKLFMIVLLGSFLFVFGSIASAQSLRCGTYHVLKGDIKEAVRAVYPSPKPL